MGYLDINIRENLSYDNDGLRSFSESDRRPQIPFSNTMLSEVDEPTFTLTKTVDNYETSTVTVYTLL